MGGPVSGGVPYLVGEKGPEIFVPASAGSIVPNDKMSKYSGTTNINMTIVTPDANSFRRSEGQIGAQAAMAISRATYHARGFVVGSSIDVSLCNKIRLSILIGRPIHGWGPSSYVAPPGSGRAGAVPGRKEQAVSPAGLGIDV